MFATVFAALMSTSIGSFMTPLSIARHLSWPIASCTAGASTFGPSRRRSLRHPCRERILEAVVVTNSFCGYVSMLGFAVELVRRHRECHEKPAGQHDRHGRSPRTRSTIAPQIRPSPSSRRSRWTKGDNGRRLSPSGQQRRQHRQRSEHRDRDHRSSWQRRRREAGIEADSMPPWRPGRHPGDQHRAARCRRRRLSSLSLRPRHAPRVPASSRTSWSGTDREADQQDDRADRAGHRQSLAMIATRPIVPSTAVSPRQGNACATARRRRRGG